MAARVWGNISGGDAFGLDNLRFICRGTELIRLENRFHSAFQELGLKGDQKRIRLEWERDALPSPSGA
jgi:hypothetical protein